MKDTLFNILFFGGIAGLVALMIAGMIVSEKNWKEFVSSHDCVVVAKESGATGVGYGMTSTGQMGTIVTTTPSKTTWKCNDGITYTR